MMLYTKYYFVTKCMLCLKSLKERNKIVMRDQTKYNKVVNIAGLTDKQAFIFTCTGGGRCFDANFQGNVNPELSEIIRQYESK